MSDINDNYARNELPEVEKPETILKEECLLMRDRAYEFVRNTFPNLNPCELDLYITSIFNFCLGSQYKVLEKLYGISREDLGVGYEEVK